MLFLTLPNRVAIAASRIEQISRPYKRNDDDYSRVCDVHLVDGGKVIAPEWTIKGFLRTPVMIMPAEPGTYLLQPHDDYSASWRYPVVGWCVSQTGDFLPLTAEGPLNPILGGEESYVLHPDGRVAATETGEGWPTEREFLAGMKARDASFAAGAEPVRELDASLLEEGPNGSV